MNKNITKNIINCQNNLNEWIDDFVKIQKDTSELTLRTSKVSITDVFKYMLKYSQKNVTKSSIVANMNFKENIDITQSSLYSKEKHITVECCKEMSMKLLNIYTSLYDSNLIFSKVIDNKLNSNHLKLKEDDLNVDVHKNYVFLGVDGTSSNRYENSVLMTDNTVYLYDVCNKLPITFINTKEPHFVNNKNNKSNKNHEIKTLMNYLKDNHENLLNMFKNKIIVLICDRAYHCMEFFKLCDELNLKYVIRVRDNCSIFNEKEQKNDDIIEYRNNDNIRKITDVYSHNDSITLSNDKTYDINIPIECNLISNLEDKKVFSDDDIKKIYLLRWNIELFFKQSKNTTKIALCVTKKQMIMKN
jgi:hypothetical protein